MLIGRVTRNPGMDGPLMATCEAASTISPLALREGPPGVPARVGKYRIDGIIEQDGAGIVYKGHDQHVDCPVAIKTVRMDFIDDVIDNVSDRDIVLQRFAAEARSAVRCTHPNIVTVFDYVEQDGAPHVVMEYVDAGTLDSVIDSGHFLPLRQVGEIMAQLLFALDHAHSKGVIHRDVKPANILCPSAASIKVTDFGVAKLDTMGLTNPNGLGAIGTPNYMSPEQFLGQPVDGRSDLFSAGVILFELLAGAKPFAADDISELLREPLHDTAPSLSTLRPGGWLYLDKVIQRALARNPDDRFSNADEFIDAINYAIEQTGPDSSAPLDLTKISMADVRHSASNDNSNPRNTDNLSQAMAAKLTPTTLGAIEAALARSLGPIANVVLKKVAQKATDADMLLTELASRIPIEDEAAKFRKEAENSIRADQGVAAVQLGQLITNADIEFARQGLLPLVGPVATLIVKRGAQEAIGHEDYFRRLSEAIPDEQQQAQFIADMRRHLARSQR